ncbi:sigma factor-like helix-turn-helix DNA-binding protein [Streptomyces sp. NBC_01089]|uniref:sigma factor-like helix-turn-helix DNA-binding protein n=1 Tax=Streptomyces sp. NBC_01089 TaxID=2903747 RepID=UPI00386B1547|nr:hypothetical protein OG510_13155 [Streptomyces sp. NBC_01089]
MRERTAARERRRDEEFESFVAGAAGRLLHAAVLLTAEPTDGTTDGTGDTNSTGSTNDTGATGVTGTLGATPQAERLLLAALSRTYAHWDRLRGDDPYEHTRQELAAHFARTAWRHHRPQLPARLVRAWRGAGSPNRAGGSLLARLTPQERLIVVLRLYEGIAEEQVAAAVGLPAERVRALCAHATATLRSTPQGAAPRRPEVATP